jgi:hypothetical protein
MDIRNIRRVITGVDEQGRSTVISDEPSPFFHEAPGARFTDLWVTPSAPPSDAPFKDPADIPLIIEPDNAEGTLCRIAEFPPDPPGMNPQEMMHSTRTVDYVLILSGSVTCIFEDGSKSVLRAGDFLVQRGGLHAWSNPNDEPCVGYFVQVGAADHGAPGEGWRPV